MRPTDNPASGPPRTTPRRRSRLLAAASVLFLCTVYMVAGTGASQAANQSPPEARWLRRR